jgi:hypothetical protein
MGLEAVEFIIDLEKAVGLLSVMPANRRCRRTVATVVRDDIERSR